MEYNRNFFIAIGLSFALIFAFQYFYPLTPPPQDKVAMDSQSPIPTNSHGVEIPEAAIKTQASAQSRQAILATTPRIAIDTPTLKGSINLQGAIFDDLALKHYKTEVAENAPNVELLNPTGLPSSYIAEFGFSVPQHSNLTMPQSATKWQPVDKNQKLTPQTPITLIYKNPQGLVFKREIAVDEHYMFTIKDAITNETKAPVSLYNYARVARSKIPLKASHTYLLHEGLIGFIGDQGLQTEAYNKMEKLKSDNPAQKQIEFPETSKGWIGITDKYWAAIAIPQQDQPYTSSFKYFANLPNHFQADFLTKALTIGAGQTKTITNRLFAGAKQVDIVNHYQDDMKIEKFGLLIDWGILSLITKPMFFIIDWFFKLFGNFGLSILAVTVLLKIITFPLSQKSFTSMARMRLIQPKIAQIKAKYKTPQEQQKATLELYRQEKINPFAGCLPILIQMPIFFALYKVLYITIEMRHAPFFGWIKDLAAPDPTSVFNLFGLLPYDVPQFLMVGAWPIIMGITMFLQMRIAPTPGDAMQAKILAWLPLIFTFMLAAFPVGLVIYWAWNNTLTIIQQIILMKIYGVKIELWQNIKNIFIKKDKA